MSASWDFGKSDPHEGRLRVGMEQKGFPTVESEQVVSGTFPSDLRKGKKEVSSHAVVIKVGMVFINKQKSS